jgi:hypothetical protein
MSDGQITAAQEDFEPRIVLSSQAADTIAREACTTDMFKDAGNDTVKPPCRLVVA